MNREIERNALARINRMDKIYNVATGIFPGFNDKQGIMLCGYEWGGGDEDVTSEAVHADPSVVANLGVIFSNKAAFYGRDANKWRYDERIREWFRIWGHELRRDGLGGDFEKCLLQTNWCDTQAPNMGGVNYQTKLLAPAQVENFIEHLKHFEPRVLMFFGSLMGRLLNATSVAPKVKEFLGADVQSLRYEKLPFNGRRFNVGFQTFERCQVISLPHPSGSRGLSPEYIKLFAPQIGKVISDFKMFRGIAQPNVSHVVFPAEGST